MTIGSNLPLSENQVQIFDDPDSDVIPALSPRLYRQNAQISNARVNEDSVEGQNNQEVRVSGAAEGVFKKS